MIIENSKTYDVTDVENVFFRPTFCGKAAEEFGIRILYNMPIPTKVPLFKHNNNLLKSFSSGWQGGTSAAKSQVTIDMNKLKAESAYSAEDYFSTVYEMITNSSDVNLGDLTGTDLEKAETELFRRALAENIYACTWFGDKYTEISDFGVYDGFLRNIITYKDADATVALEIREEEEEFTVESILLQSWLHAKEELRALASDGNLAYFVSSDIYDAYQFYLDKAGNANAYADAINGRPALSYHGIPIIEVPAQKYDLKRCKSFCILTDRRNLVLALNTADSPEKEIKMWYNPDEMENRQRVVFLVGTAVLEKDLLSGFIFDSTLNILDYEIYA